MRLVLATILVAWGACTDRPWTVGVACMPGLPSLWPHGLVVALAALPFLTGGSALHKAVDAPVATRELWSLRRLSAVTGLATAIGLSVVLLAGAALERALLWASAAILAAAGLPILSE